MPPKRKEAPKRGQASLPEEEDEKLRGRHKAADAGADGDAEGEDDGSEGEVLTTWARATIWTTDCKEMMTMRMKRARTRKRKKTMMLKTMRRRRRRKR